MSYKMEYLKKQDSCTKDFSAINAILQSKCSAIKIQIGRISSHLEESVMVRVEISLYQSRKRDINFTFPANVQHE